MSITFKFGDMFNERVDAIVNTVNCVGVMGKGVALEFKKRWPENYKAYKKMCEEKVLRPGNMFVFENTNMFDANAPQFLINFPTKDHWRSKSQIGFIIEGLDDLVRVIIAYRIKSIALPPLGCGNGGLDWAIVKPLIIEKLQSLEDTNVIVFEPQEVKKTQPEHVNASMKMTFERAMLIKALGETERYFSNHHTRVSLQKITYFLQTLGINYNLAFSKNIYGPYSETLKTIFTAMEEQGYITGFTSHERKINVTANAYAQAEEFLNNHGSETSDDILKKLSLLIDGYETPYGMELLSTVHYLVTTEHKASVDEVVNAMHLWSERKLNEFNKEIIETAYKRLKTDGLIN